MTTVKVIRKKLKADEYGHSLPQKQIVDEYSGKLLAIVVIGYKPCYIIAGSDGFIHEEKLLDGVSIQVDSAN